MREYWRTPDMNQAAIGPMAYIFQLPGSRFFDLVGVVNHCLRIVVFIPVSYEPETGTLPIHLKLIAGSP